jgi:hypothetical protein
MFRAHPLRAGEPAVRRRSGDRAIRFNLFAAPRQKVFPLLSLARAKAFGFRLGSFAEQNSGQLSSGGAVLILRFRVRGILFGKNPHF